MPQGSPKETDVHVGRRIRMRRMELRMPTAALAKAIGITFQQIQKYEKGTNRVGASRLQAIATALDVPVSFFFDGLPQRDGATSLPDLLIADLRGIKIARLFVDLPEWQRDVLLAVAETLSQHSSTKGE